MRQNLSRLGRVALSAAFASFCFWGTGCDSDAAKADRKVRQKVEQTTRLIATEAKPGASINQLLTEAVQESTASPAAQATANAFLAESNYALAVEGMPKLARSEATIHDLVLQARALTQALARNNASAAAMAATDPKGKAPNEPLAAFDKQIADQKKLQDEAGKLATDAEGRITQKKAEIDDLQAKQNAAVTQANDLMQRSEQAKGKESVDLYKQSLEPRAQIATFAYQLGRKKAELADAQTALAEAQGKKEIAAAAIKTAQTQLDELKATWEKTQQTIAERATASKAIADKPGLAAVAEKLAATLKDADAQRKVVAGRLDDAAKYYGQAPDAAAKAVAALRDQINKPGAAQSPATPALRQMQALYAPAFYHLCCAKMLHERASIDLNEVAVLDSLLRLSKDSAPIFRDAKLSMPAELAPADLEKRITASKTSAQEKLNEALDHLKSVEASPSSDKLAVNLLGMATEYSLFCLTGDAGHRTAAHERVMALANTEGVILPKLPDDLGQPAVERIQAPRAPATQATPAGAEGAGGTDIKSRLLSAFQKPAPKVEATPPAATQP